MSNLIIQEFKDKNVRFEIASDGKVWGCLTDMVKSTGKRIDNYLTMQGTTELIRILQEQKQGEILQTRKGRNGGTWAVEEIVTDFAYWSNLDFRLWVLGIIQRLRSTGVVMTGNVTENAVINEWENQGKDIEDLKKQLEFVQKERNALKSWSPDMPMHKIRFFEIINYKGEEYSPFLERNGCRKLSSMQDWEVEEYRQEMEEKKLFQDLVDTLFESDKRLDLWVMGFTGKKAFESFMEKLPVKLFRVLTNPYRDCRKQEQPKPSPQYEKFQFSVELKNEDGDVWLEYVPEKEETLREYLFDSEKVLVG